MRVSCGEYDDTSHLERVGNFFVETTTDADSADDAVSDGPGQTEPAEDEDTNATRQSTPTLSFIGTLSIGDGPRTPERFVDT